MRLATMAPRQPPTIWATMYRPVSRVEMAPKPRSIERDDGVEVGAGDGAEHPDQRDQGAGGGRRVLQELQADVVG